MYGTTPTVAAAAAAPALAATGLNWGWSTMVAFSLLVIGGALLRLVPKSTS
jgi:hypothetical protein